MAKFFLINPGFELGDRDWTKAAGWTIVNDAGAARSGSWVAKSAGAASVDIFNDIRFFVRPGTKISVSVWIETLGLTGGGGILFLRWSDLNGASISTPTAPTVDIGQAYTQATLVDLIAPDRAKEFNIAIRNAAAIVGGSMLVDDFDLSGDLIETIPTTAEIASHRMVPADTVGVFDPLVGQDKFTEFNAGMSNKWSGVYTFIPALGADLGELVSFIRRLGRTERFFAFDPDRTVPLNGIVNDMTVDGPITNGTNKIPVKAGPVSSTALVAGDYMEVKDQYFQLQRDLEIGPEGTGEAIVFPAVRSTLADGEDVITNNPKMVARITSDLDWRRIEARPVELTIAWEEV